MADWRVLAQHFLADKINPDQSRTKSPLKEAGSGSSSRASIFMGGIYRRMNPPSRNSATAVRPLETSIAFGAHASAAGIELRCRIFAPSRIFAPREECRLRDPVDRGRR